MKSFFTFCLVIGCCLTASSQNFYLKVIGQNEKETRIIDSINYKTKHLNTKSIINENNSLLEKLTQEGYTKTHATENFKSNDSTFCFKYNLDKKINFIHIYVGNISQKYTNNNYPITNDTINIPYKENHNFLNSIIKKLESDGFSTATAKLTELQEKKDFIVAKLIITKELERKLNDIVIPNFNQFPKGHKKQLLRLYQNKIFNQKLLEKIHLDFEKFDFVKQIKYPEILFTKDSTKAYVYLEKRKTNTFDGYIGFSNNSNNKTILSGYLDLTLNNSLNFGEKFSLLWKNNGQDQKSFYLNLELPYIFKSPLAIKANLTIYKQNTSFQNTKTAINLGYFLNYNTRLYLGHQSSESSDIQNTNSSSLNNYNNSFLTSSLEYTKQNRNNELFRNKTTIDFKIGYGKRTAQFVTDNQFFGNFLINHNFHLNNKNIINIKSQNFYLLSKNYLINELSQFGGINSIRGFVENSLQGNLFTSILTEYRYIVAPNLYIHSIADYGLIQDKTQNQNTKIFGLGLGLGLLTNNGILNILYTNGNSTHQNIKLSNSIIQLNFKSTF